MFLVAPNAPNDIQVLGLTPNGAVLNVSLFDGAWENITMLAQIIDAQGNRYPVEAATVEEVTGRHALVRITPSVERLPPGQEYIISIRTLYNQNWSVPFTVSSPLGKCSVQKHYT